MGAVEFPSTCKGLKAVLDLLRRLIQAGAFEEIEDALEDYTRLYEGQRQWNRCQP